MANLYISEKDVAKLSINAVESGLYDLATRESSLKGLPHSHCSLAQNSSFRTGCGYILSLAYPMDFPWLKPASLDVPFIRP